MKSHTHKQQPQQQNNNHNNKLIIINQKQQQQQHHQKHQLRASAGVCVCFLATMILREECRPKLEGQTNMHTHTHGDTKAIEARQPNKSDSSHADRRKERERDIV